MTYKYLYIRRAIYEKNPADKLNSYRSLADMRRLLKLPYWLMLGFVLLAIIAIFIIAILNYKSPLYYKNPLIWIPAIIIVLVSVLSKIPREKYLYNTLAREDELSEQMQDYKQYVSDICDILRKHGIDTSEKVMKLKTECETIIKMREDKFVKINSKIVDMLIGVPLGALIASIIYAGSDAITIGIGAVIIIGLAILGVVKLIRSISYYSEGYFKDKYLLDAINELNYSEKALEGHIQK